MLNTIQEIIGLNSDKKSVTNKIIQNVSIYLSEFFKDKEPLIVVIKEYKTDRLLGIKVISEELEKNRYKDFFREHIVLPNYKSFNNKGATFLGKYEKKKKDKIKEYLKKELNLSEEQVKEVLEKIKEKNENKKSKSKKNNDDIFLLEVYKLDERLLTDLQNIIVNKIRNINVNKICPFCKNLKNKFTEDTNNVIDVYNITNKFFFPFWIENKLLICIDCFLILYAYYPFIGFLVNWKSRYFYSVRKNKNIYYLKLKFFPFKTGNREYLEKLIDNLNDNNKSEKVVFEYIIDSINDETDVLVDLYFFWTEQKKINIFKSIENVELKNILKIWELLIKIGEQSSYLRLYNKINSEDKEIKELVLFDKLNSKEKLNILDALYSQRYKEESKKFIFDLLAKILNKKQIDFNKIIKFFNTTQSHLALQHSPKEFIKKFIQLLILLEFLENYYSPYIGVKFIKSLANIENMSLEPEYYFAYIVGILLARLDKKMWKEGKKELGQKILSKSSLDLRELGRIFNKIIGRLKIYNIYVNDLTLPEIDKINFNKKVDKDLLKFYLSYGYLCGFTNNN